jgi:hypothetical protein
MQIRIAIAVAIAAMSIAASASPQSGTLTAVELDQFSAAPSSATGVHFGRSLVVDGDRMLCASGNSSVSTHAETLVRVAGVWTHEANLYNAALADVATSLAGDLALIGARVFGPPATGRVLVARRSGAIWSTTWLDSPDAGATVEFGACIALSGTTVVVSDRDVDHGFANEGALYVYEDTGANLVLRQTIYGGLENGALGARLAVHGADLLASVQYEDNSTVVDLRAFQRQGGQWIQTQRAVGLKINSINEVARVEIDDWGLAVLTPVFGGAYMLASTGDGLWFRDATFIGTPSGTGWDVQVSDGVFALAAPTDSSAGANSGAVYLYARNNGWKMMRKLVAADARPGDRFGYGIELRGSRLFVGASGDDDFGADNGAVYEYGLQFDPARVYCVPQPSSIGCVLHIGFDGIPSAASSAPFTLKASKVPSHRPGFFVYSTSGAQFTALGTGVRCFAAPRFVTAHQLSGGNSPAFDCTGKLSFDCNALIQSGSDPQLVAGVQVEGQFVCRDPANPSGITASDAIEFTILP